MKKLILATTLLVCGSAPLFAGNNHDVQQQFITAEQQADLFHDAARPFQLEVDFIAQLNIPTQGHLTLKWEGQERWWSKVVMGEFEQITIRNGAKLYISRNADSTPFRLRELTNLLYFANMQEEHIAKKQRHRVENGVEVNCIEVERENEGGDVHEVCVDPASHEILSVNWQEGTDELRRELLSDYFEFDGRRYPRKLQLQADGSKVVSANVSSLRNATFDENLLVPPKGAIERRQCENMRRAIPVKTPQPFYPSSAKNNRMMGDATVAMVVQADGAVSDIQLIGKATRSIDDSTLKTLKSWRFRPAMCGTEPVVSDIVVVVSFRLN